MKRSGSNGARSSERLLAAERLRDQAAGDRAERHAGALVAGRDPQARHGARRPDRRAGCPAATAAARPTSPRSGRAAQVGHERRRAGEHRFCDGGSTAVSKPRRARLEPTSTSPSHVVSSTVVTWRPGVRAEHRRQVGAVDDLVADPARLWRREPHELAPARLDRQLEARAARQRRAPGARGQHDRVRGQRAVRRADAGARPRGSIASTAQPVRTSAPAFGRLARQRPRDRPRRALEVAGEEATRRGARRSAAARAARTASGVE